jgi:hypothetical protein
MGVTLLLSSAQQPTIKFYPKNRIKIKSIMYLMHKYEPLVINQQKHNHKKTLLKIESALVKLYIALFIQKSLLFLYLSLNILITKKIHLPK